MVQLQCIWSHALLWKTTGRRDGTSEFCNNVVIHATLCQARNLSMDIFYCIPCSFYHFTPYSSQLGGKLLLQISEILLFCTCSKQHRLRFCLRRAPRSPTYPAVFCRGFHCDNHILQHYYRLGRLWATGQFQIPAEQKKNNVAGTLLECKFSRLSVETLKWRMPLFLLELGRWLVSGARGEEKVHKPSARLGSWLWNDHAWWLMS